MNNTSQCIFDISHVLRSIRDTMELVLPNQIKEEVYKQRKAILKTVMDPKSFLGKFIKDNEITAIINCAAYTNVDKAEDDFINADEVNYRAVRNMAYFMKEVKISYIQSLYFWNMIFAS